MRPVFPAPAAPCERAGHRCGGRHPSRPRRGGGVAARAAIIAPRPSCSSSSDSRPGPFDRPSPDLAWLCHPVLTGLPAQQRDALITALMTPHDQQRETSLDKRRGHRPRRRPPARPHPGRPPPGHHPAPAPCPAPDRHRRLVRRPAGDGQQAHPRHPRAPGPGRVHHPAWPAPARQPGRPIHTAAAEGILAPAEIKTAC